MASNELPKSKQNRPHSDSIDSGFDSLGPGLRSVKSEGDITKMLNNGRIDQYNHKAFSDQLEGKLKEKKDGAMIEDKHFVGALLTNIGGFLIIRGTGVCLYVPPDALLQQQFVYIRILPPPLSSGPTLKEEETCLTPVVECGPPGLEFQKKVSVTIPHCASEGKWQFTVHQDNDGENWKRMANEEVNIKNASGALTFEVLHFTRFTASGSIQEDDIDDEGNPEEQRSGREIESKWMKAVVSLTPQPEEASESPQQYTVKVQISNTSTEDAMEPGVLSCESFCVKATREDLKLLLIPGSNSEIVGDSQQVIEFDDLWSNYQEKRRTGGPSATFVIKTATQRQAIHNIPSKFKLKVCQGDELGVTRDIQKFHQAQRNPEDNNDQEDLVLPTLPYYNQIDQTSLQFLEDITFRKLCVRLDGNNPNGCGWEAAAPNLGLSNVYVITAIKNATGQSPSGIVLNNFFKSRTGHNACETLKALSNVLAVINNHDARDLVEKAISVKGKEEDSKPTTSDNTSDDAESDQTSLAESSGEFQAEKHRVAASIVEMVLEHTEKEQVDKDKLVHDAEEQVDNLCQPLKEECNTLICTVNSLEAKASGDESHIEKLKNDNEDLRQEIRELRYQLRNEPLSPGVDQMTLNEALDEPHPEKQPWSPLEDPEEMQCSGVNNDHYRI